MTLTQVFLFLNIYCYYLISFDLFLVKSYIFVLLLLIMETGFSLSLLSPKTKTIPELLILRIVNYIFINSHHGSTSLLWVLIWWQTLVLPESGTFPDERNCLRLEICEELEVVKRWYWMIFFSPETMAQSQSCEMIYSTKKYLYIFECFQSCSGVEQAERGK